MRKSAPLPSADDDAAAAAADGADPRARPVAPEAGRAAPRGGREGTDAWAVFEAVPSACVLLAPDAPAFTIVGVNDAYLRATMTLRGDLLGRALFDAFPENPDDPAASGVGNLRASLERVLATRRPDRMATQKYDIRRPEGEGGGFEERWWSPLNTPVPGPGGEVARIIHQAVDVTERERSKEALRASEERYRSLFDSIDAGFCLVEVAFDAAGRAADYRFIEVNPAFERQTGLEDAAGKWMRGLAPAHERHWFDMYGRVALTGEPARFEHQAAALDDRWYDVHAYRVGGPDERRVAILFNDVSDRRRAEEVLATSHAELERLVEARTAALLREVEERRRAEEALRQGEKLQAIGQLTGGIAHDFNNIMQVVTSGAALLRLPRLPDAKRAAVLDGLTKAAKNAKELTDRLLSFARKQTLQPEAFDLNARLGGMSELLRHTLGSRIAVETDFAGDLAQAMADPSQLEVAVLNLAVNARDAMLPDGGTLTLQSRNARLDATSERAAGDYVCLAIKDTGRGMSPAVMARVFEPFFTTKGPEKGTGLGLAQVHGFAKQSGGDIAVESTPGQGATITLHLPRAMEAMRRVVPARVETAGAAVQRAAGRTVLVVDDNPDVAAFAASMLESLGYSTRTASNAADASALVDAGEPVDAVFSDVMMPGEMNGVQLARLLRRRHPRLALVLATGYSEALADGGDRAVAEVLGKPYRLDHLAAALDRAFAAVAAPERREPSVAAGGA